MNKEKFIHYIKENLLKGYSIEHIRKQLLRHGYPKEEVESAIKSASLAVSRSL